MGCYCSYLIPNRRVEHPRSKSTQPRCATTMVTLYNSSCRLLLMQEQIEEARRKLENDKDDASDADRIKF